jgi:hypothetical protein
MNTFALNSAPRRFLQAVCSALLALMACSANAQDDPPAQAGRISSISGTVSIQPVSSQDWGQAYPNLTIGPGDRIFTDSDGRAEVQVGQTFVRIGPNSDVSLVEDSQFDINFGVAQGSVRLHTLGLWPRQLLDVSTPNGNVELDRAGDLRIDVFPQDGATTFTNLGDFADLTAAGDYRQELDYGQSIELAGSNPVSQQWLQPAQPDDLDYWSQQRDQQLSRVSSYRYVSPEIPGAADLDGYGDWQPDTEYGAVWFPRNVSSDWAPYHNGHWVNHEPWGWVWVEDEPWGYAPFHYGRWVSYGGRWGWIPGSPSARPVWSPALVVFAGGIHVGGLGVSAWFPLGPGEAYRPWYHASPRYIDQVNITNIRESNRVHVQNTYVNVVNVTNVTYINQSRGVSAMRQEDFAAGRSARNAAVRVDSRDMSHVQPLVRPDVAPTHQSIVTAPVAHPVHVSNQRPNLINQQGKLITAQPGAAPVAPPVRPAPPVRALPGRTVVAAPAPVGPAGRPMPPGQQRQNENANQPTLPSQGGPRATPQPVTPAQRPGSIVVNPNQQQPNNPNAPNPNGQQPGRTPIAPGLQPSGRPMPPPNNQQQAPNQPQPIRPNSPTEGQPQGQPAQQNRHDRQDIAPNPHPTTRPNNQPPVQPAPQGNQPQFRPVPPPAQQAPTRDQPQQYRPAPPPAQQAPQRDQPQQTGPVPPPTQQAPPRDQQQYRPVPPPQQPRAQPQTRPAPPPPQKEQPQKGNKKDDKKDDKKPQQ